MSTLQNDAQMEGRNKESVVDSL